MAVKPKITNRTKPRQTFQRSRGGQRSATANIKTLPTTTTSTAAKPAIANPCLQPYREQRILRMSTCQTSAGLRKTRAAAARTGPKQTSTIKAAGWHSPQLRRRIRGTQPLEALSPSDAKCGLLILFNDCEPAQDRQLQQDILAAHRRGERLTNGYLQVEYNARGEVIGETPMCAKQRPAVIVERDLEHYEVCRLYPFRDKGLQNKSDIQREQYVGVHDHRNQEPRKPRYGRPPLQTGYLKPSEKIWKSTSFIRISDTQPLK